MILIHGRKRSPQKQITSAAVRCPHCLQNAPISVVGCSEYFHLYYIPFFGWKSTVYMCSGCEKILTERRIGTYDNDLTVTIPTEAKELSKQLMPNVKIPWYYFIGFPLVACGISYLLYIS